MIHVIGDWYVNSDGDNNFILQRKVMVKPKDGGEPKEGVKVYGYYGSIEYAIDAILTRAGIELASGSDMELSDVLRELRSMMDEIRKAIKGDPEGVNDKAG